MRVKICLPRCGKAAGAILGAAVTMMTASDALAEMSPQLKAGLQKLGNVRVEVATPLMASQSTGGGAAFRAFKDPVTGELVEPDDNELVVDRSKRATAGSGAPVIAYRTARGGISVPLDESFLVNAVVTRGADGKLDMQCVGDGHAAAAALDGKAGKVHRHDR